MLALRAYVRYLVPFTLLSALVLAPALWLTFQIPIPGEPAQATRILGFTSMLGAIAWIAQLVLVGGVAPAVRAVQLGAPLPQLRALGLGIAGLVKMVLPCLLAVAAIGLGSLALVLPGLALLVLLSVTGASTERGMPGPLLDSIAVVRANLKIVAIAVAAMLVLDLALPGVARMVTTTPLPKKPTVEQLAAYQHLARMVALALVIASPIIASVLAAIRVSARPPRARAAD
ncbi:MAG: hypothetical protein H6Q90_2643 [Deltaproteobacteria bacterium]|nr:hypothetical protein [Deltaproteobacteria bacterium]